MKNIHEVLEQVKLWVAEVGEIQRKRFYEKDFTVQTKSCAIDLVTEVDKLSEEILITKIRSVFPEHSILSEESGASERDPEYLWIIDPLDGTTNYAHQLPIFGISVALRQGPEMIMGVIYQPVLNDLYYAVKGEGAFQNGKKIEVSGTESLKQALLATGFPYDMPTDPGRKLKYFNHLVPQIRGVRRMGCAVFDLCNVAAGRFDGYWELNLKSWDVAAGSLIVEEAGGKIIYLEKEKGISLVAGNDLMCKLILEEIRKTDLR
jgi:myo-inositol-1(or 4)-monophosphatase